MVDTEKTGNALDGTAFYAVSEVGRGGMGTVLLAEHRMLKKRVAVKLLNIELSDEENLIDRLRVEAEILANLSSPHVPVHRVSELMAIRDHMRMGADVRIAA